MVNLFSCRLLAWCGQTIRENKMPNKQADHRRRQNFALDRVLVQKFKEKCAAQGVTMSAKIAELIKAFLRSKGG